MQLRRKPRPVDGPLWFGSLFHLGLNAWWLASGDASAKLQAALAAVRTGRCDDPFELVKIEVLLVAYSVRWGTDRYTTEGVEVKFDHPVGLDESVTGSMDGLIRDATGRLFVLEHKTTSSDISIGSIYWQRLQLDSQVSTYIAAAPANVSGCLYDVIRKPYIERRFATPLAERKYTLATRAAPIPRLYANQRDTDESLDEYRIRLQAEVSSNADKYFKRQVLIRFESELREHERDVTDTIGMIADSTRRQAWPRHTASCERFSRLCDYHGVCTGAEDLDGSTFENKPAKHEELMP